jgi:hypothetical protein
MVDEWKERKRRDNGSERGISILMETISNQKIKDIISSYP